MDDKLLGTAAEISGILVSGAACPTRKFWPEQRRPSYCAGPIAFIFKSASRRST